MNSFQWLFYSQFIIGHDEVIFIRLIKSKNPFMGDESHLHHNLLNYGFNHKQSVYLCTSYLY